MQGSRKSMMNGLYAAKKVVVIVVFFITMLLMKNVMDTLLPPPHGGMESMRAKSRAFPEGGAKRLGSRVKVRPDAIVDLEAEAEEMDMGPEVVVNEPEVEAGEEIGEERQEALGEERAREQEEEGEGGGVEAPVSLFGGDDKVYEDPRQVEEDQQKQQLQVQPAAPGQQPAVAGLRAPDLGGGGDLQVQNPPPPDQAVPAAAAAGPPPTFGQNYYTIYINKNSKMDSLQIIPSGELFQIRVKACSDAYLIYKQKNMADEFCYHVGFGYGKKTVIWKQPPDPVTREYDTPETGYLSCDQLASYWVRHAGNAFTIGVGGEAPFIDWKDPKPFDITSISLATPHPKQTAVWHIDINSVHTLRADTGEDYSYEQVWVSTVGKQSIILQVRACHDAHVLLSDLEGAVGNVYEVVLGMADNSKTVIREDKFGPNIIFADTPEIMNCGDTKAFWFTWSHNKLTVGRGTRPGTRVLLSHGKQNHPSEIRSVSMSTGWGATGKWLFNMDEEHLYPPILL